jgi:uncharacterized damage-inducible protein DinB
MPAPKIQVLLSIIDQAYDRKSWHGTNLRGSIRGLSAEQAASRPAPQRHNIWEIVLHTAYWKYVVYRRLTGEPRGSFPLKGSNWFVRPQESTETAWNADIKLLSETHKSLRAAIAKLNVKELYRIPANSKLSNFALISGIAAHDLYHAGQIQLLKRLAIFR